MKDAVSIFLVEDDDGHARLIEKNIRRSGLNNPIVHFRDGASALAHLFDQDIDVAECALVLLDLNLPDMTGTDVLSRIKGDPNLRGVPVIVLTTTDDKLEIQRCYDLGCNIYMTKPLMYNEFADAIRHLGQFLSVMQVPQRLPG